MKRIANVLMAGLVLATVAGIFAAPVHAAVWLADVVVTPAPCAPVACARVVCAPVTCARICTVPARPCYPERIGFWTGPARSCGEPTYNEYNTATGTFNRIIDVGLNASGQSAIRFTNATGGWTVLKKK